jgi:hypothetical protein
MRENVVFGLLNLANSLKTMFSSSIHLPVNDKISFFMTSFRYTTVSMTKSLANIYFIYSSEIN